MLPYLIATKNIIPYLIIFFLFRFAFKKINGYYLKNPAITPYPIDVDAYENRRYASRQYIIAAKKAGYDHRRYYQSFLPLDLIFPFFYSLLFLSCLLYCSNPSLKTVLTILIIAGASFDWLEDLSFAIFLASAKDDLAGTVAFFTTVKTIVFILNLFTSLVWIAKGIIQLL